MSAATITPPPAAAPPAPPALASAAVPPPVPHPLRRRGLLHRLTVKQYHAMIDAGILKPGSKVELVEGLLLRKPMTRKPPHDTTIDALGIALRALFPPTAWWVRDQKAITLPWGEPEPDLAVVLGPFDRYLDHHPGPAEIGMVCEVSDTTLRIDRGLKLRNYARAGIPVYWLVNLRSGEVEVYTDPHQPARRRPRYRSMVSVPPGQSAPVVLAGATVGTVAVADLIR